MCWVALFYFVGFCFGCDEDRASGGAAIYDLRGAVLPGGGDHAGDRAFVFA